MNTDEDERGDYNSSPCTLYRRAKTYDLPFPLDAGDEVRGTQY